MDLCLKKPTEISIFILNTLVAKPYLVYSPGANATVTQYVVTEAERRRSTDKNRKQTKTANRSGEQYK